MIGAGSAQHGAREAMRMPAANASRTPALATNVTRDILTVPAHAEFEKCVDHVPVVPGFRVAATSRGSGDRRPPGSFRSAQIWRRLSFGIRIGP